MLCILLLREILEKLEDGMLKKCEKPHSLAVNFHTPGDSLSG